MAHPYLEAIEKHWEAAVGLFGMAIFFWGLISERPVEFSVWKWTVRLSGYSRATRAVALWVGLILILAAIGWHGGHG